MTRTGSWAYRGVSALVVAIVGLALVVAPAAAAEDPAAWMYSPRTVSEIDLTLPPSSYKELEEHPEDAYVPGTFAIAETDGVPGTAGAFTTPIEVGVRLKGGEFGSLRTLDQKAAFKVKFDEFVEGQTFLGLKKLTLNNMVEDPSMVHEAAAYEAFGALGVPSPHTGFAFLRVNGESFGLHLNIETLDKVALEKRFGPFLSPPQHLYEGEYGADVTQAKFGELEVDEGKKKEKGDLEALVAAVAAPTPSFSGAVGPLADLDEMSRMWAVEKYAGQWDGYSGQTGEKQPNNYYLYSDASGRFQMLPWGTDETWGDHIGFDDEGGVLFNGCLADTASPVRCHLPRSSAPPLCRPSTASISMTRSVVSPTGCCPGSSWKPPKSPRLTRNGFPSAPGRLPRVWSPPETSSPTAPVSSRPSSECRRQCRPRLNHAYRRPSGGTTGHPRPPDLPPRCRPRHRVHPLRFAWLGSESAATPSTSRSRYPPPARSSSTAGSAPARSTPTPAPPPASAPRPPGPPKSPAS